MVNSLITKMFNRPLGPCLAPRYRKQPTSAVNDGSVKVETPPLPFQTVPRVPFTRPGSSRSPFLFALFQLRDLVYFFPYETSF